MTNEELDRARAEEAAKRVKQLGVYNGSLPVYSISAITEAARLAREGWTPPVAVDPDLAEAWQIYHNSLPTDPMGMTLRGIKRGRELERAVMGNPIPEQIQEVTPPEPVNPDLAEAWDLVGWRGWSDNHEVVLSAIKRGRALAAEAKPGMVWVKHDGSEQCPVIRDLDILTRNFEGFYGQGCAQWVKWPNVTHYAIITPPTEDK